ncbi:hypothetical protein F7984_03685 [Pradoshia sp. D12]|uniref:Ig-like domain-containing protein n=1 Tax=Bacillaceae TaxID=186817 RepID=UPI00112BF0BA|nr:MULTISPECIES: Ig-like domain-containing protein [Bacillaceae]QFK70406.1 hypothetical protein F7984_03685 [Pradoshia sp. D12]TPF72200.1 hypothetical protein FHY44_00080 [Bacillus sp. D12]
MLVFLVLALIIAFIAFLILSIIGFIKKNGKGKKNLILAGGCFLASFVFLIIESIVNPIPMEISLNVTSEIPEEVKTTQDTITIKGTVEHADQLKVNGKTVTIKEDSFSTDVVLEEGENPIVIYANNEEYSKELKYEVMRAYPPIDLNISYDSHIEVPSYTLKGTVQPGATVILNKDGTKNGEVTADANGTFSFKLDTKAEGTYNYVVDANKEGYTEEHLNISINRTIPNIPLTVTNDSQIQAPSYTIKGKTEPGATVTIMKDEKKLDQATAGKDGTFSFNVNTKEKGEYKYTIKATKENFKEQTKEVAFTRTLSAKEEAQAKRANAKTISFDKLNKNPDRYKGEYVKYRGEIVQIMESDGMTAIRLSITPTSYGWSVSDIIYVAYLGYTDFVDEDVVTIYGEVNGSFTYTSQAGWDITLPLVIADSIE